MNNPPQKGWYSRGYLPHIDGFGLTQFITFRLYDSFPELLLREWRYELAHLDAEERGKEEIRRMNRHLDLGHGSCWLARPEIAELVQGCLLHNHGVRYDLRSWVIMPNHVHVLVRLNESESSPKVMHTWKSYTAHEANHMLGREGKFWYREFFVRYIRDEEHYANVVRYIDANPVKAGLCAEASEWPFSSARRRSDGAPS